MLLAAEVALIGIVVAVVVMVVALILRRRIGRLAGRLVVVLRLSILRRCMASWRSSTCPSCTTVRGHSLTAATACSDTSEGKEDEEGSKDDEGQDNPSTPVVPA